PRRERAGASVPSPQDQADQSELQRAIAAIDEPERQRPLLEEIGAAEGGRDPAGARAKPVKRALRRIDRGAEKKREGRRRDQREHNGAAEDQRFVARMDLLLAKPRRFHPGLRKQRAVPKPAKHE